MAAVSGLSINPQPLRALYDLTHRTSEKPLFRAQLRRTLDSTSVLCHPCEKVAISISSNPFPCLWPSNPCAKRSRAALEPLWANTNDFQKWHMRPARLHKAFPSDREVFSHSLKLHWHEGYTSQTSWQSCESTATWQCGTCRKNAEMLWNVPNADINDDSQTQL